VPWWSRECKEAIKERNKAFRVVPWWSRECKEAIKERNKAFRVLKRTHNFQHLIEYKRAQAMVRQNVRKAKREYWKKFCDSLGRTTPIEKVWGMIRKMKEKMEGNMDIL